MVNDEAVLHDSTEKRCCCNVFNIKTGAYAVAFFYCIIIVSNLGIRSVKFAEVEWNWQLLFLSSDSVAVACLIYGVYRSRPAFLQPFTVVSILSISFCVLLTMYYAYAVFKPASYFGEQIEIQLAGNVQKIAEYFYVDQKRVLVSIAVLGTFIYAGTVFVHAWFMVIVVHCAQEFRKLETKPALAESLMLEDKEACAERSLSPESDGSIERKILSPSLFLFLILLLSVMASKLVSLPLRVVYVTVPNKEVALNISKSVVEKNLAACVNIVPGVTSVYEWESKVNVDDELLLIIKTQESKLPALHETVSANHPYDTPEFISLPVDHTSEKYGSWVMEQTSNRNRE